VVASLHSAFTLFFYLRI